MEILKEKKNSGFTLVEVIVVLVILAILMAIAIPALTGYIDKATERKIMAEARQAVVAAQTVATVSHSTSAAVTTATAMGPFKDEVTKLSEIPTSATINDMKFDNSTLTELLYTNEGKTVLYKNGQYIIVDGASAPAKTFTNAKGLTGDAKTKAIEDNMNIVGDTFKDVFAKAIEDALPDGAVYWSKGAIGLNQNMGGCSYFDANGKPVYGGSNNVDMTMNIDALAKAGVDTTVDKFAEHLAVQRKAYFNPVNVGIYKNFETTPYCVVLKNNQVTGATDPTGVYTIDLLTGKVLAGDQSEALQKTA